jgi:hypothetical protein
MEDRLFAEISGDSQQPMNQTMSSSKERAQ